MTQVPDSPVFVPVWLAPSDVTDWLRNKLEMAAPETAELHRVCCAAEIHAEKHRPDMYSEGGTYAPDAEVYQGAVMYAAREIRRRNTPAGVESFGDTGISFVAKYDPDIDRALHTGAYTPPAAGG